MATPSPETLFAALRAGERTALGRAITLVESTAPADRAGAMHLLERCAPHAGNSLRLGITGVPGVGKSTLIDALGSHLVEAGHRVAVLAVDPSSRRGGSILGDKTRMERLARSANAFIRPTAAGGTLGGVARCTREAILLCEAAGYDHVLVETVGTGQNELEVDQVTDLNLLLLLAGAGDELQGIKRGIMESADLIAFTKADGTNAERVRAARRDLLGAIALLPPRDSGRRPDALITSATTGEGIPALAERIHTLHAEDRASGRVERRRSEQALHWMEHAITEGLRARFDADERVGTLRGSLAEAVRRGELSPFHAAERLLQRFTSGG
jgi:LAO/AO transport system kinase